MATLTFPLSRIEGHARVVIEVHGGEVVSASFQAMEMRGFGYFVQGTPAEQMPVIVPRICGVCSTAHHVAAVKALEDAYGITPPPLARKIRELLLLGQLIQNQATSLFIFTMPDRLNVDSIFSLSEEEAAGAVQHGIPIRALQVRKTGTDLITLAGGQFIHPIKAVIGGVSSGIPAEAAETMRNRLVEALPVACDLFSYYWETSLALRERIGTWGDDAPACYIASTGDIHPNYDSDSLHVQAPDGTIHDRFSARNFRDYLSYQETEYSYAGQTSYRGEVLRANSLARINMTCIMATPRADQFLARFQKMYGQPAHAILLFDLCRGIELVYALERAIEILAEPLDGEVTLVPHEPRDGEGYGLVEAPRGPLIHHYTIEKGLISQAEFIIPTVHNMLAIERALRVAANRYITPELVNLELERAVGRVVRAFDPCIACATH
ncbi:MAG: Ni/Fe hydrogenase subunit alpha [Chloroflexota bacterium]|nr:MAG: Ni/Fe hydrogenase subunit alpha [Chloroflexota bacterium]